MQKSSPFSRSIALRAAIHDILSSVADPFLARTKIGELDPYVSRGHGGKHTPHGSRMKVAARMRAQNSKYQPHQGAKECARRLRSTPESKPRRMWQILHWGKTVLSSTSTRRPGVKQVYWFRRGGFVVPFPVLCAPGAA